jgi:hypothetical protein
MKHDWLLIVRKPFSWLGIPRVPVLALFASVARKTGKESDEIGLRRYRGKCEFVIVFLSREVASSIEGKHLFWVWMDTWKVIVTRFSTYLRRSALSG